jgi:hypothetical protein
VSERVKIRIARDDAGMWHVERSNVPGVSLEAGSLQQLVDQLPGIVAQVRNAELDESELLELTVETSLGEISILI